MPRKTKKKILALVLTLMQDANGMLHLAFAYQPRCGMKGMFFTEESVMGKKREKVGVYNPTAAKV